MILAGEAPAASIAAMKAAIEEGLPEFSTKFKFSISPRLVGVQGAAQRACQTITDEYFQGPGWMSTHVAPVEGNVQGGNGHDEI